MYKYFKTISSTGNVLIWGSPNEFIIEQKSKGLSNEVIKPPNNTLAPGKEFSGKRIHAKFKEGCLKQDKGTSNHGKIVKIFLVCDLEFNLNDFGPALENYLFGAVKLTKNSDIHKYQCSVYGLCFDSKGTFLHKNGTFAQNVIVCGCDLSSSSHANNRKNNILVLGKDVTQGISCTTISAEKMYSINFTVIRKKICSSLHYNGSNSYLFVNQIEICRITAKDT